MTRRALAFSTSFSALLARCGGASALLFSAAVLGGSVAPSGKESAASPASLGDILYMLGGLALVIGSIFVVAWLVRRFTGLAQGGASDLKVLGGLSMGARERVVLVQAGETQLLLGIAPGRVQTLHVFERPVVSAASSSAASPFGERLRQAMKRRGGRQ